MRTLEKIISLSSTVAVMPCLYARGIRMEEKAQEVTSDIRMISAAVEYQFDSRRSICDSTVASANWQWRHNHYHKTVLDNASITCAQHLHTRIRSLAGINLMLRHAVAAHQSLHGSTPAEALHCLEICPAWSSRPGLLPGCPCSHLCHETALLL